MKKHCWFLVVSLLFGLNAGFAPAQERGSDRDRFVGAWKLVTLERPGADGQSVRIECCGMFVFTKDGHLSVQVMERESKAQTAKVEAGQYSQGRYEASYGSYVVDERNHTFRFHVEGALVRGLIGKDLLRRYEFRDGQLIVESARTDEHWRVIWGRY